MNNEYKYEKININDILLDINNPRYSTYTSDKSNMVSFMMRESDNDTFELTEDILLQQSLNPLDTIGLIEEGEGKYIVVDGNRRITSLKIINNHLKMELDKRYVNLFGRSSDKVKKIKEEYTMLNAVVFSGRKEANIWIERKHTSDGGKSLIGWPTFEKHLHKNDPATMFVLKKMQEYNVDRSEYVSTVKWSVWDRIFKSNLLREYFSIKEVSGKFSIINEKDFQHKTNALMTLMSKEDGKAVLSYNKDFVTKPQQRNAISEIDKHLSGKDGLTSAGEAIQADKEVVAKKYHEKNGTTYKKSSKISQKKLKFKSTSKISNKNNKLVDVLRELEKINIKNYPSMSSFIIRPIVEITTYEFLRVNYKLFSQRWWNETHLKDSIILASKMVIDSKLDDQSNKTVMKTFASKQIVESFLLETNGIIHDAKHDISEKSLIKYLRKVDIYMFELWTKIK